MIKTFALLLSVSMTTLLVGSPAFARTPPQTQSVRAQMSRIIIPELKVEQAKVSDVLATLVRISREADPNGIGVNMILMEQTIAGDIPKITLDIRGVNMLDALDLITDMAGLSHRVDRNIVMVEGRGKGNLETRFYAVDPSMFTTRMKAAERR
ncbi:MAG: hypothetical protein JJU29_01245 [Verrucomicrobia bacterium]|nr:hypothetical protein [Verrucomicrobiota bacterium]MCH8510468.1 hypothetical protein [Kiritimatiellia bacterium]